MRQLWLEKIGYAHGDLRLDDIPIDVNKDVKIADFDATVEICSELLAGTLPWAKEDAQGNCPQAGPETEQFSLGSCMFNIRYGRAPYAELESPVWYEYMSHRRYPSRRKVMMLEILFRLVGGVIMLVLNNWRIIFRLCWGLCLERACLLGWWCLIL